MTTPPLKRACVIGWPIEHSRSPLIHNTWISEHNIDASYEKVAVAPNDAPNFMQNLKSNSWVGCSVTVPLKEIAFKTADWRDESANAVEAANTLWFESGKLCAMNTDTYGFMTHLEQTVPNWTASNKPVSILGAGGAARAIIFGFFQAGINQVRLYNRTKERAIELQKHFGSQITIHDWQDRTTAARDCSVIVNTTTIGMNGEGDLTVDLATADKDCVVYDIVYTPLETAFLRQAKNNNLRTVDGLGMLLHQAVPGFEKWFGIRPKVTNELRNMILKDIEQTTC